MNGQGKMFLIVFLVFFSLFESYLLPFRRKSSKNQWRPTLSGDFNINDFSHICQTFKEKVKKKQQPKNLLSLKEQVHGSNCCRFCYLYEDI